MITGTLINNKTLHFKEKIIVFIVCLVIMITEYSLESLSVKVKLTMEKVTLP